MRVCVVPVCHPAISSRFRLPHLVVSMTQNLYTRPPNQHKTDTPVSDRNEQLSDSITRRKINTRQPPNVRTSEHTHTSEWTCVLQSPIGATHFVARQNADDQKGRRRRDSTPITGPRGKSSMCDAQYRIGVVLFVQLPVVNTAHEEH